MANHIGKINKKQVIKQFMYAHVFFYAGVQILLNGFSKKGLEIANLSIENKVLGKLRKKYASTVTEYRRSPKVNSAAHCNKVWVCWLQGMESAPALVQKCYESLQTNLRDKEIVLLTESNYRDYISFPGFIEDKIKSGAITRTHLSDLMRIELLTTFGGTWIDATVFCSGGTMPQYLLDSDLFLYQALKPALSGHPTRISSWFMTANANSDILNLTKKLLYAYWEKNSAMVTYFLLHDFIELAIEVYPEEWNRVNKVSNGNPHVLQYQLGEPFCREAYDTICRNSCFHKLTYKNHFRNEKGDRYIDHLLHNRKER